MVRKHTSRLIVVVLLFVPACTDDPSVGNTQMRQDHVAGSDCANESHVPSGEGRTGGSLTGDFDLDGQDDDAYVAMDRSGEPGCKSFLVIDAGDTVFTTAIDPSGTPRALPQPSLNSMAEINGEPGPEILVNVESGASTQFVAAFTLGEDHSLARMTVNGKGPGPFAGEMGDDPLFAFGGSVGHLEAIDCSEDGSIVMAAAIPAGDSADNYVIERRFFEPSVTELVLDRARTEKVTVAAADLGDLPEFASSPFGSCD